MVDEGFEDGCVLYYNLKTLEKDAKGFIHAKNHGAVEGYDNARDKARDLINKARDDSLENLPLFDRTIKNLEELYKIITPNKK